MAAMFEKQKIEGVKMEGAETIVGSSVKLKGNLKSDGDIIVNGTVNGELKTKGAVVVGEGANIIANIKAQSVVISGSVQGNIEVSDALKITETGRVLGDVSASVLSISPGAVFSGSSRMNENHKEPIIEPTMEDGNEEPTL